jgi:hypothetical protein
MPRDQASLLALRDLIADTDLTLESIPDLPQNGAAHCRENLRAALALVNDLVNEHRENAAAVLGSRGGRATAQKFGREYFRQLVAKRKTRPVGRPKPD